MHARSLAFLLLLSATPSTAGALPGVGLNDTVWVDPVLGNDFDTSTPFRTIGAAVDYVEFHVPLGERFVRLHPGEYGQANGETYPISLKRGTRLSGTTDTALAHLVGDGALVLVSPEAGVDRAFFECVSFRGLASQASVAIQYLNAGSGPTSEQRVEVHGCAFENLGRGIRAEDAIVTDSVFTDVHRALAGWVPDLVVTGCVFQDCEVAIGGEGVEFDTSTVEVSASRFLGGSTGIMLTMSYTSDVEIEVSTSRFEGLERVVYGSHSSAPDSLDINALFSNSVFTANGSITTASGLVDAWTRMQHCTLDGQGVIASPFLASGPYGEMQSCISVGHTDRDDGFLEPQDCYLQSSAYLGVSGNFTASEPGFVDVGALDYRLHAASVCVDRGGLANQTKDYRGLARLVDGDLDGQAALDPGAHELQTLIVPESVRTGEAYRLELNGPAGQPFLLILSRTGLDAVGSQTAYGVFSLPVATSTRILSSTYPAGGPASPAYAIAQGPSLVGNRYAFQALTFDGTLQGGAAWGQAGELVVLP